ncbi:hypothetical protein DPM13_15145 [Paracoccus mutanolyticus]|uniref:Uncharacterized protein n=1 Tax=Paracoccus mutanolyticus TaxID=1499308 RepID=A0ABM6WTF2_9RHOB|nr:hypothetical protein DPM13_15145 [Paracoccus mutanolyticus]
MSKRRGVGRRLHRTCSTPTHLRCRGSLFSPAFQSIDFWKALRFTLTFTLFTLPLSGSGPEHVH